MRSESSSSPSAPRAGRSVLRRARAAARAILPSLGLLALGLVPAPAAHAQTPGAAQPDALGALTFRNLGPAIAGGRVAAVVGVPGNPSIYYVGAAGGGVWKSTDGGNSWKAIFTHEPVTSIGAIALAPSNPDLVWVGTGEAAVRSDVITGHGIYFSPDAGATWKFMGLADAGQISSIVVNPQDASEVWVGVLGHAWGPNATRGVYRTMDGGKTWQQVLKIDDKTGVADLVMEPGNPMVLFAAAWQVVRHPWGFDDGGPGSGIYRSIDGGTTWTKLENGLPKGPLGRIGLAAAPNDPQRLYALIEAKMGRLWITNDLGAHWHMVNNNHDIDDRPWYFSRIAVSPVDANRVYFLDSGMWETEDGGRTIRRIGQGVHPDNHTIWIDPKDPDRIIEGNDGGVVVSHDAGEHWRFLADLPIEQFYQVAADSRIAFDVCGGLQDNNAWCGPTRTGFQITGNDWYTVAGGDGEYAVPAPSDPDIVYADSQNGSIRRTNLKTGASRSIRPYLPGVEEQAAADLKYRFGWTSPIEVSATDANTVYIGGDVLFKSTDGGLHWQPISPDLTRNDKAKQQTPGGMIEKDISGAETYDTILSFAVSRKDPNTIWVGTDDGLVQVTRDGGAHWTNVTGNMHGLPEWGRVQQIEVSPFDPATCYVAVDFHETDDNHPYVYKTHDYGKTWTSISAGLPAGQPARVVREDPNHKGFLVAGTDTGLFFSRDDGADWQPLKGNLPTVTVYDVQFVAPEHSLMVATHGRGLFVLDNITPLEDEPPAVLSSPLHVFPSLPAYLLNLPFRRLPSASTFTTPNPPTGVMIDYYLKTGEAAAAGREGRHEGPVTIRIADAHGATIDVLHGPARAGINRVVWNMSYARATPLDFVPPAGPSFFFRRSGPPVVPGTYQVTVEAGGQTGTTTAVVKPDPDFPANLANFEATTKASLEVRDMLSSLDVMLNRLTSLHEQLHALDGRLPASASALKEQARALDQKVEHLRAAVYNTQVQPGSEDSLHYLSAFHDVLSRDLFSLSPGYDLAPRADALAEIASQRKQLDQYLAQFNDLLKTDVAAFNRAAQKSDVDAVYGGGPIAAKGGR
ncbi:MAG: hypothetical protein KGN76_08820 [Acidobacteriota bacterium]|nr:hypothetical protein [Acidobacteriota bacterium]